MTVSTIKMTANQFLELGEDPPGVRLELVNGEVAVSPSPTPEHSNVVIKLVVLLGQYVEKTDLGNIFADVDTILDKCDVRRPDLLYFAKARLNLVGKKAMEGPPDLCVEVISPSSGVIDRKHKFRQYADAKVPFYWIIDPEERTFEAFRLERGAYQLAIGAKNDDVIKAPPFDDLEIALTRLWHLR